jgi:hypothetical protein
MNVGKGASETSALLALAHGEYAMKRSSVLEWHRREHVQEKARSGQPKRKCGQSTNLVRSERGLGVKLTAEDYMNMFRGKDLIWPDKWIPHHDNALPWCVKKVTSSWLRNPLNQWTTRFLGHQAASYEFWLILKLKIKTP